MSEAPIRFGTQGFRGVVAQALAANLSGMGLGVVLLKDPIPIPLLSGYGFALGYGGQTHGNHELTGGCDKWLNETNTFC